MIGSRQDDIKAGHRSDPRAGCGRRGAAGVGGRQPRCAPLPAVILSSAQKRDPRDSGVRWRGTCVGSLQHSFSIHPVPVQKRRLKKKEETVLINLAFSWSSTR